MGGVGVFWVLRERWESMLRGLAKMVANGDDSTLQKCFVNLLFHFLNFSGLHSY